jgi:hypothetical protein
MYRIATVRAEVRLTMVRSHKYTATPPRMAHRKMDIASSGYGMGRNPRSGFRKDATK